MADVWSITPIGTPILDRCKPLPRNWWAGRGKLTVLDYFIVLGFMAFAGAGTVALLIYFPQAGEQLKKLQSLMPPMGPEESPYLVPLYPLSYFAVGFLVLLVHELGHVIGGISVSYHLRSVVVFPFMITMDPKPRIQLLKRTELLGFVLFDHSDPTDFSPRYAAMVAAGPLASLSFAAMMYPFWRDANHFPHWFAGALGAYSLFIGLLNLVPFHGTAFSSDGSKLWMLLAEPERLARFKLLLQVQEMVRAGISLSEWPPDTVNRLTSAGAENSPEKHHLFWFGYCWFSQQEDPENAAICLERCLETLNRATPGTAERLKVEATIFHAWHRRDIGAAEAWLADIKSPEKSGSFNPQRLKIALACARGEYETAMAETGVMIAALEKVPPSTARDLLQRGLSDWQSKIEARATEAALA